MSYDFAKTRETKEREDYKGIDIIKEKEIENQWHQWHQWHQKIQILCCCLWQRQGCPLKQSLHRL